VAAGGGLVVGRVIFALAIIALGIETWVFARVVEHPLGATYNGIPVIPWLPAIPWLAYLSGAIWVGCGVGILLPRTMRMAAITLGILYVLCSLIIVVPKNAANIADVGLRTVVFEPLAIATLAWLMAGFLERASRYILAIALIAFGVDHFIVLKFIAGLIPGWIPWHVFWSALFGVAFIASGVSIALKVLPRWGAAGMALMFGIWVITLHLPRVMGLYGIAGAPKNPNEWSSLLIATALWGGFWALADQWRKEPVRPT
jgi:uncharacterized membrane protein